MSYSPTPPSPYEVLGISTDAELVEIKAAREKLSPKYHPDRCQDGVLIDSSINAFVGVQQACALLTEPARRAQHEHEARLAQILKELDLSCEQKASRSTYTLQEISPRRSRYKEGSPFGMLPNEAFGVQRVRKPYAMAALTRELEQTFAQAVCVGANESGIVNKPFPHKTRICWVGDRYGERLDPRYLPSSKKETSRPPTPGVISSSAPQTNQCGLAGHQSNERSGQRSTKDRALNLEACVRHRNSITQFPTYVSSARNSSDSVDGRWRTSSQRASFYDYSDKTKNHQQQPVRPKRTGSVRSGASSTNRSLRGGRKDSFDLSYQKPGFSRRRTGSASSYEIRRGSPRLPPEPIKADSRPANSKVSTRIDYRDCYICGEGVLLVRKRDWQKHLYEDLRPYQCIETDCPEAETTYSQARVLRQHYEAEHPDAPIMSSSAYTCVFCEEELSVFIRARFRHVGRHLEDHAFSVIPRQQRDWQFYSDSETSTNVMDTQA